MKAEIGKYHFGRRFDYFTIRQWDYVGAYGTTSRRIKDVDTYAEAVRETYRLNGWGEPKSITRKF